MKDYPVVNGTAPGERVDTVTFDTGSVFFVKGDATPLLTIPQGYVTLSPQRAWRFTPEMPRVPAEGGLQGAALRVGKGRVLVFADSGVVMTPDLAAKQADAKAAMSNAQLFLNSIRWLSGSFN